MNIDNQSANLSNEDYAWYVNDSLYYPNFNEPFFLLDTGFYTISTIASNQFGCTIDTVILDSVPIYDTTALPQPSIIRSTIIENSKVYTEWTGTSYTLNHTVTQPEELEVFVNNVRQNPGDAYTVNHNTITFAGAISSTDSCYAVFQNNINIQYSKKIDRFFNNLFEFSYKWAILNRKKMFDFSKSC